MAYNKQEMINQSLEAIKKYNLVFQEELFAYVPFSGATFYNHKLEELETIKKAFDDNRIRIKGSLRKKWYDSDNFSAQVALYKLIGNDEERKKLSQSFIEIDGETKTNVTIFIEPENEP